MGRRKVGTCVFCGQRTRVTREHVVPRGLFEELPPRAVVTIPACLSCNNGKSRDDTYLRDYLLSDLATRRNPVAQALRGGKFKRSVKTNRSELARSVIKDARRQPLYSPGGIYLGSPYAAPVSSERLKASFAKIARGLYFHVTGSHLPQDIEFNISRVDGFKTQAAWDEMKKEGAPLGVIHKDVFACRYAIDAKIHLFSRWHLLFYNTILIEVDTMPKDWLQVMVTDDDVLPASGLFVPGLDTDPGAPLS